MKNWRTSAFGIVTVLVAVLSAAKALLDGDPTTNPDLAVLIASLMAGAGLLAAKDFNVTGVGK